MYVKEMSVVQMSINQMSVSEMSVGQFFSAEKNVEPDSRAADGQPQVIRLRPLPLHDADIPGKNLVKILQL